jgi:hypothetical protein
MLLTYQLVNLDFSFAADGLDEHQATLTTAFTSTTTTTTRERSNQTSTSIA